MAPVPPRDYSLYRGTGCEIALPSGPVLLCGKPAYFMFHGEIDLLMCLDHTKRQMQYLPLQKRGTQTRIVALTNTQKVTMRCTACLTVVRLHRVEPSTAVGTLQWCPQCGHKGAFGMIDTDQDWWDAISDSLGMDQQLVRLLYDEWDATKHTKFVDYVKEMLANA